MSNIDVANRFLVKAEKALDAGHFERAKAYTAMAAVVTEAHKADKIANIASAIDRLADVVNAGGSWR